MGGAVVDLWRVVRSIDGRLAALLCSLPIGTGAALGVLAQEDVAKHWGAGATEVGLVNGVLSGVLTAGGCVGGGWLCSRFPSRHVYAGTGAAMALVALAMALVPVSPAVEVAGFTWGQASFVGMGVLYSVVTGVAFAAFTGVVMEVIGAGAAATKYNVFASLSNVPIAYMGLVLAAAVGRWGPQGMLVVEALAGFAGIVVFAVAAQWLRAPAAAPEPAT